MLTSNEMSRATLSVPDRWSTTRLTIVIGGIVLLVVILAIGVTLIIAADYATKSPGSAGSSGSVDVSPNGYSSQTINIK
jgi:hypothetical protein